MLEATKLKSLKILNLLLELLFALAVLNMLGVLIYCAVLAMPLIITALSSAAMPYGFAVFISILPLLLSIILAYKTLEASLESCLSWIHDLLMLLGMKSVPIQLQLAKMRQYVGDARRKNKAAYRGDFLHKPFRFLFPSFFALESVDSFARKHPWLMFFLLVPAFLVTPSLALYLSAMILPAVVPAIIGGASHFLLAIPILAFLSLCLTVAIFLNTPLILLELGARLKKQVASLGNNKKSDSLPLVIELSALVIGACLASGLYPLALSFLLTLLPQGMAIFATLALSVSLTLSVWFLAKFTVSTLMRVAEAIQRNPAEKAKEGQDLVDNLYIKLRTDLRKLFSNKWALSPEEAHEHAPFFNDSVNLQVWQGYLRSDKLINSFPPVKELKDIIENQQLECSSSTVEDDIPIKIISSQ